MRIFSWPIRVYYEDTDAGGVVFYANYLKFFERARTEMLRDSGFEQDQLLKEQGVIFVVRSVQVDYLKPAQFNDQIVATATVIQMKKTSFVFKQEVLRGEQLLCKGEVVIVCVDAETMRPKAVPQAILEKL